MDLFAWTSIWIPDWGLVIGATAVAFLNVAAATRRRIFTTTRYDRIINAVAYAQLAAFYVIILLQRRASAVDLDLTRGLSRFVWLWFIGVGLIIGWRMWKQSDEDYID